MPQPSVTAHGIKASQNSVSSQPVGRQLRSAKRSHSDPQRLPGAVQYCI